MPGGSSGWRAEQGAEVARVGMPRGEGRHRGAQSVGRGVGRGLAQRAAHLCAIEPLELSEPFDLPVVYQTQLLSLGEIEDVARVRVGVEAAVDEYLVAHRKQSKHSHGESSKG